MFYMIKHLPTGTWVPKLLSSRERSHYYSFLEGKQINGKSTITVNTLDFKRGFKYKDKTLAEVFVSKLPEKLRLPDNTAEEILAMFEIEEYETYPQEQLCLCLPKTSTDRKSTHTSLKVDRVLPNWFDYSNLHCNECGALIPPGMKYLEIIGQKICSFCVCEAENIIEQSVEDFSDKVLFEEIETARFINRI